MNRVGLSPLRGAFWWAALRAIAVGAFVFVGLALMLGFALEGWPGLATGAVLGVSALPYVLFGALILGLAGLVPLRLLRWTRWQCYVGVGALLGAVAAVGFFGLLDGTPPYAWITLLSITGASVAASFWHSERAV
jgi:hypothetical protein